MLLDTIRQFNWVDIFVIIVLFRIGYIAIKGGLPVEFFKLLGTLAAIYLPLHYYTMVSDFIRQRVAIVNMPLDFVDFLFFIFLAMLGYLIFLALRSVFTRFIKMEAVPHLNKWGGFILGVSRGFLCAGLIIFILVISTVGYLKTSVKDSYLGSRLFNLAPATYNWLWNNFASKFMSSEKFNKTILEVQENFAQK